MSLSDSIKLDFLWKKIIYGVSNTAFSGAINSNTVKDGSNETIPSTIPVYSNLIYSKSSQISSTPPINTNDIIQVYTGANAIHCKFDRTVNNKRTWIAVSNVSNSEQDSTNWLIDWIPPTFGINYAINVWAGQPGSGTILNQSNSDNEWIFDYSSGVLTFPNNVPTNLLTNDIYIEGYRYIGPKGMIQNSSKFTDLTDVPQTYIANAYVKVNSDGDGLIFDTNFPTFIGKASQYFTINLAYTGDNLTEVTTPTGWSAVINNAANGDITITHTTGSYPIYICSFGHVTAIGATTWRLRTPSTQFELRYDTTISNKFQIMRASWAYTGTESGGSANLYIFF